MRKSNEATPAPRSRILLIDDSRNGLLARKAILTEEGYSVTACSTPEEALQCFAESRFDLVVTDYRMPHIDGIELIARIRELNTDIPVVLVSGMVEVLGLNEKNTGADAVVAKSATEVQHMVRAVKRLLTRGTARKPVHRQGTRRVTRVRSA